MKATKSMIGQYAYPNDNSYSFTIGTDRCPYLANMWAEMPERVLIVSPPYRMIPNILGLDRRAQEFVTVFHGGKCHVILNSFYENKEAAELSVETQMMLNEMDYE